MDVRHSIDILNNLLTVHIQTFFFSKALLEQQTLTYIKIQNMNADAILSRNEMEKRNFVVEAYQQ